MNTPEQIEAALIQLCRLYGLGEVRVTAGRSGTGYSAYWQCSRGTRLGWDEVFAHAVAQVMIDTKSQAELNEWRLRAGA